MLNYCEGAAAALLSPEEWLITGGYNNYNKKSLASTEIQHKNGTKLNFIALPRDTSEHVLIAINNTHTILVGGGAADGHIFIYER